ncbi:DNA mismatch repair protein MutL [Roseimicrobium gellanilyticum]|uniref:DNA mismatch repair protein MutL n=1 Tax=Roseimicrobium gellanilyticum TaxID=748857 RepID=A0A366HPY0_9BACT|nr:DNA mismatch repair endonuclease MutL [Roseimicrobium gellanilyticum]RBP44520.1 DNA mismatch repair protein MutL [Roseimicrobium gellanilyticum]
MSRIRILPDALASQVAAGEVVERPAAVVRELVDNSIDAGATHVEVHVQRGGSSLIRVVDNGHGMGREDALLCLERHATSKIHTKEDLASIRTLGFRGEAMPSVASVSRFRLATREPDALAGTEVEVHGGKMHAVRDYGGAPGTVVEARSLFYNIPARRKFLRSEATEYAHVEQQFRVHAVANPRIAFTLVRDGEVLFHLPATDSLLARIEGLCGADMARRLYEVEPFTLQGVTVQGYIAGPGVSRANRQMQFTFLNKRSVDSPTLAYGLREAYHTALMKGQHPITFLYLEMEPDTFDINVHPAKKEVRFHNGFGVREAVVQAVRRTLEAATRLSTGHMPMPQARSSAPQIPAAEEVQTDLAIPEREKFELRKDWSAMPRQTAGAAATPFAAPLAKQELTRPPVSPAHEEDEVDAVVTARSSTPFPSPVPALVPAPELEATSDLPVSPSPSPSLPASDSPRLPVSPSPTLPSSSSTPSPGSFRILGVLHKLYVLMENAEGLVLMDQHAAHERVLFEQMRRAMETEGVPSQRLLIPLTMQTTPRDFDILSRNLPVLHKLGIEAEPFGTNAFKLDALPAFVKTDDPLGLLRDVLDELAGAGSKTSALRLGEDMIATTVCRHAVKANDNLRDPELKKLLEDLLACEMPYCCPHGRPTLIQISLPELERKFGRRAP